MEKNELENKIKELELELSHLNSSRNLVEQANYPILILKGESMVMDLANEAILNLFHLGKEALGKPFLEILPEMKDQPFMGLLFDVLHNSITHHGNNVPAYFARANGEIETIYFNFTYQPYKENDGTVSGVLVFANDVTDHVKQKIELEKTLLESASELQHINKERVFESAEKEKRSAELVIANKELTFQNAEKVKRAEELVIAKENEEQSQITIASKQQFLANMSHEIRTPMTAIIGFSKVVLKSELTAQQREYINAIKTSSDALLVLINDILDLAKVDAGKMIFEQNAFEMETDISAMLHLFDLKVQEKNLKLIKDYDTRIPKVLIGDSVRLNQIILNLVSNAIKFTSKGKITLSVRLIETNEEKVTIKFEVADTGIGLDENMIPTIFESFQQANSSTTRQYGGTGLGLAIVKQLVERQGGTIDVKSKINEGSTFGFVLSFQKLNGQVNSESSIPEINPANKNIKVLAVEDIVLNQMLLKIILDDFGFQSDFAENGIEAIEKLKANSYDIILMDIQMPVMGGLECTEYIRNIMNSKIPIIALTADVTMDDLEKCKAIGINDHIAKPIDEKLLYNKIVELVIKP